MILTVLLNARRYSVGLLNTTLL